MQYEKFLLGETSLVPKPNRDIVLAGTQVKFGEGKIFIIGVGIYSQVGSIDRLFGRTASE